ncbi:hypothetical protein BDM02DRAFT_3257944 [Thelephora ganbajun]|uniref:Uncharacterized protein n=1 Tax=Thelephora ganbajun TaxID=370292 RepID=A0ACB6ZVC1_THEGA|nr:hypothetical protein BDM02DRAFT_3257944 [Thelephora ganbajun]
MDSIIEVQRQTHEEIEHFECALYQILAKPAQVHQQKVQTEHRASQILDRISARVNALNDLYQSDDTRKQEIAAISGPSKADDLSEFYSRLGKIQEHHAKYPDGIIDGFELELLALTEDTTAEEGDEDYVEDDPIGNLFSGEESYGKYLDLYANHTAYNNLRHVPKRVAYLQYLDVLIYAQNDAVHNELPRECRITKDYENYIRALYGYLASFLRRSQPLVDYESQRAEQEADFGKKWETGEIDGWEDQATPKAESNGNQEGIWCSACQKMYSKQTVYDAHLTSKKHIKATQKQATSSEPPKNPNGTPTDNSMPPPSSIPRNKYKSAALYTHLTTSLLLILAPVLADTKSNVERRFSLTAREREQELLEQSKAPPPPPSTTTKEGGEEEEEERIYNPLKLPLGWDGKPIPYWLYKLHGLGVEYRCEICSDHVYMGRKNFERHFQESRHAFGMRALGLPNTKHFHEITKIEDALALAEKLKREGKNEIFEQETMEELEDEEGNVYNRKTYEDLKKQGLI